MHLRRVERILASGEGILTNCPSEPVLRQALSACGRVLRADPRRCLISLSATYAFRWNPLPMWAKAIAEIIRATSFYGVVLGDAGEEFVLVVFMAALDGAATKWRPPGINHTQPSFGGGTEKVMAPVDIDSWLSCLINGERVQSTQRKAFKSILAWGAARFLNFIHFTVAERQFTPKKPLLHCDLVNAWLRHVAIIGYPGQMGWDIIIPYYEEYQSHGNFVAAKVSYIAIQVKNAENKDDWKSDFRKKTIQSPDGSSGSQDDPSLLLWLDTNNHDGPSMIVIHEDTERDTRSKEHIAFRRHLRVCGHDRSVYTVIDTLEQRTNENVQANLGLFIGSLRAYRSKRPRISDPNELYDQIFWKGYLPCLLEQTATTRPQSDLKTGQSSKS